MHLWTLSSHLSEAYLTVACTSNPKQAVYNRAFSFDKLGRHERALADYTHALQMQPNNSTAYHNRGNTLEKMGRLEAAMADFTRAADLDTNSSASKHARALLLDKMGRHQEALTDFSAAITQEPLNPVYYHNRGLCYRNLEDYSKVLNCRCLMSRGSYNALTSTYRL
jgi:tetratricopeptide (TPR) repeat protein